MDFTPLFRLGLTLSALWHVLAYAAGAVFVYFSYRALWGFDTYESRWGKIIRGADIHLWLSGFVLIAFGILLSDFQTYLSNPKLWTKVSLVVVWLISTQVMRRVAVPALMKGKRDLMLMMSGVSLSCWFYGAFLGCAKPLAYGKVPFEFLAGGFILVTAVCLGMTYYFESKFAGKKA